MLLLPLLLLLRWERQRWRVSKQRGWEGAPCLLLRCLLWCVLVVIVARGVVVIVIGWNPGGAA